MYLGVSGYCREREREREREKETLQEQRPHSDLLCVSVITQVITNRMTACSRVIKRDASDTMTVFRLIVLFSPYTIHLNACPRVTNASFNFGLRVHTHKQRERERDRQTDRQRRQIWKYFDCIVICFTRTDRYASAASTCCAFSY